MKKTLIIVESPAKIKTLKKFLGSNYFFESSVGHIRDLPTKGFGIDVQHDFEPQYVILEEKKKVIQRLKQEAKKADYVYLAPDPDREGEAIAWHICSILPSRVKVKRVTFNAITKEAVLAALKTPRDLDLALVDAQQARRLLDRIVGYKISPILTRRVQGGRGKGLSAGRVQSVALKLIVDREREIELFKPVEYWTLLVDLQVPKSKSSFTATLHSVSGKRVGKEKTEGKHLFLIPDETTANSLIQKLRSASFKVVEVERKERRRYPVPPFITSTLQQEASRHFGFSATRTMHVAQTLYEGVELGKRGSKGLITYMRTDSVRIEPEVINAVRQFILKKYGEEHLPKEARHFTTKKSAQDAHEAIRPTHLHYSPEEIQKYLSAEQQKLYSLIWHRFIASQMNPVVYDTVSCSIETSNQLLLRATGSVIKFSGFLILYEEKEDQDTETTENERLLPPLKEGEVLKSVDVKAEQSFTKSPPRYTEASLVKELEKQGIGRPSTYATIMQKIQNRDYTLKEKGALKPTELGRVIAQMLEDNFKLIMNVTFTATMEDALEQVAENKISWKSLIAEFWKEFIPTVESAEKEAFVPKLFTDISCPKCHHRLQKIWSRNKYFYGCSNYPECDYTSSLEALHFNKAEYAEEIDWEQPCPKCQAFMKIRFGRFGAFLGCENYPKCKGIVNLPKKGEPLPSEMPHCPALGCDGKLTQRRSRFGKLFFSCSNYPDCDVIINSLEELSTKYVDYPKTPYVKKKKTKGKPTKSRTSKVRPQGKKEATRSRKTDKS